MSVSVRPPLVESLRDRPLAARAAAVVAGTVALTLSSWAEIPMYPVPMTLQTYAVVLIGALYGWRLGALTVVAWLLEGGTGLPVFAGGAAGAAHFFGPTGGYLLSFPALAAGVGALAERGWAAGPIRSTAVSLLGHALCLLVGTAWLAVGIGPSDAVTFGLIPFLPGAALKSLLVALTLSSARRIR